MDLSDVLPGMQAAPNAHPLFVHFPLALLPTALGFLVLGTWMRREFLCDSGRWLLYLGTVSAIIAAISGWFAAEGLGHGAPGHEHVHAHRTWMLSAVSLSAITSLSAMWSRRRIGALAPWWLSALLVITCLVAALGADRGVYLVYGQGVGAQARLADAPAGESPNGEQEFRSDHEH